MSVMNESMSHVHLSLVMSYESAAARLDDLRQLFSVEVPSSDPAGKLVVPHAVVPWIPASQFRY